MTFQVLNAKQSNILSISGMDYRSFFEPSRRVHEKNPHTATAQLNQETLLRRHCPGRKCFPVQPRGKHVAKTNFAARKQKLFLPKVKNIFVSRTQIVRPQHMFPSLATIETMLISFQCRSLIKTVSQQRRAYLQLKWSTAKKLKQVKLKKRERNWKNEIEILIMLQITLYQERPLCIRLARGKFELSNQDSVGGKNSSILMYTLKPLAKISFIPISNGGRPGS